MDRRVRDRISTRRRNPLALLELPRGFKSIAVPGRFGSPGKMPLTSRIEQGFVRQLESLSPRYSAARMLVAAAEPVGDVTPAVARCPSGSASGPMLRHRRGGRPGGD